MFGLRALTVTMYERLEDTKGAANSKKKLVGHNQRNDSKHYVMSFLHDDALMLSFSAHHGPFFCALAFGSVSAAFVVAELG